METNIILKVKGQTFRCECGCNVFTKESDEEEVVYFCNSCKQYYSENGDE